MFQQSNVSLRLKDYLTVSEAAEVLGVSPWTLRNWDNSGKLKSTRHPKNGYRIYRHEDLAAILQIDSPTRPDWNNIADSEHFVQFYESDDFLVKSIADFAGAALQRGDNAIVVATPEHRRQLAKLFKARGLNCSSLRKAGKFLSLDAAETLSKFMVDGMPEPKKFLSFVGKSVARMSAGGQRLRAFGEMVALLWNQGNRAAAIRLEELWNDLSKHYSFALFCAYPMSDLAADAQGGCITDICTCHSRVIPAESFAALGTEEDRRRAIARLQQKAVALQAEIAHREEVEKALARRESELADFVENAIEGLHQVDADGKILWANKAELNLLGYAADEYIGHHISEFHVDKDVSREILAKLGRGETLYDQPARLRCKDGSTRHATICSNACFDDGKFLYTRCFTRDVTHTKLLEEERHRFAQRTMESAKAEAKRTEFLFNAISHDLRTPLNGVLLLANLAQLSLETGDTKALADSLAQIRESIPAACRTLDAILQAAQDISL